MIIFFRQSFVRFVLLLIRGNGRITDIFHGLSSIIFMSVIKTKIFLNKSAQIVELFLKYAQENTYRKKRVCREHNSALVCGFCAFFYNGAAAAFRFFWMMRTFWKYFPLVYHCYLRFNLECPLEVQNKMNIQPLIAARACAFWQILPQSMLYGNDNGWDIQRRRVILNILQIEAIC